MTTDERNILHALTEAVAADPRDLGSVNALADFLEERSLETAAGRIRRLVPENAEILVMTYTTRMGRESAEDALRLVSMELAKLGRHVVWIVTPAGSDLRLLRAGEEARRVGREMAEQDRERWQRDHDDRERERLHRQSRSQGPVLDIVDGDTVTAAIDRLAGVARRIAGQPIPPITVTHYDGTQEIFDPAEGSHFVTHQGNPASEANRVEL